jgi:hypothetical protein
VRLSFIHQPEAPRLSRYFRLLPSSTSCTTKNVIQLDLLQRMVFSLVLPPPLMSQNTSVKFAYPANNLDTSTPQHLAHRRYVFMHAEPHPRHSTILCSHESAPWIKHDAHIDALLGRCPTAISSPMDRCVVARQPFYCDALLLRFVSHASRLICLSVSWNVTCS